MNSTGSRTYVLVHGAWHGGWCRRDVPGILADRMRPQPLASYRQTVRLSAPLGNGLHCSFVSCRDPVFDSIEPSLRRVRELGWPVHEVEYGHDLMLEAPLATARLLERLADPP